MGEFGAVARSVGDLLVQISSLETEKLLCETRNKSKQAVLRLNPYTFQLLTLKPLRWWTGGDMPLDVPVCGFQGTTGPCALAAEFDKQASTRVTVGVVVGAVVFVVLGTVLARHVFVASQLASTPWQTADVNVRDLERAVFQAGLKRQTQFDIVSPAAQCPEEFYLCPPRYTSTHRDNSVSITRFPRSKAIDVKPGRKFLVLARETLSLNDPSVTKFHGVVLTDIHVGFAFEYCKRGDLHHFLHQPPITLDSEIKHGLILDVLQGLKAVHDLPAVRHHGLLNCSNCVADYHFTLKLTDIGIQRMASTGFGCEVSSASFSNLPLTAQFHMSPEQFDAKDLEAGNSASDMFSVGTLCAEIVTEGAAHKLAGNDLLRECEAGLREIVLNSDAANLVQRCSSTTPADRPRLKELLTCFRTEWHQHTVEQKVLNRLSRYAGDLERTVGLRTQALLLERQKCDQLLSHMLPVSLVVRLRKSLAIEPETFDLVTMQFSDIVGFVDFVQTCTPLEVVDFLNQAHGLFATVISEYDVYKVETIADSYFIVSGLPERNGDRHTEEVCRTAIRMQKRFHLAHFRSEVMSLRIGIHTGPCVAAVVGLQRPRYCLFGDTVNTTSRMETHGKASRIHLSKAVGDLIKTRNDFNCSPRGEVEVTGKGKMFTYWLLWKTE